MNSNTALAYFFLDRRDKAVETVDSIMAQDTVSEADAFNAANLYSLLGDKEKALSALRQAFEKGFRDVVHARMNPDFDNIRDMPEFAALIDSYTYIPWVDGVDSLEKPQQSQTISDGVDSLEKTPQSRTVSDGVDDLRICSPATEQNTILDIVPDDPDDEGVIYNTILDIVENPSYEVPFTKEGGVTKVKCTINGLPLYFVFDTGAADVTLSLVEANFMLKNEYIKPSDVIGSTRYVDANGDISEGTVINLRKIDFGGIEMDNVRASVVRNQKAPLLLGQSVLGRLGRVEIDNESAVIRIYE